MDNKELIKEARDKCAYHLNKPGKSNLIIVNLLLRFVQRLEDIDKKDEAYITELQAESSQLRLDRDMYSSKYIKAMDRNADRVSKIIELEKRLKCL
jgi:hypothetical protein